MAGVEQFRLKWNQHLEGLGSVFREARQGREFADVTLACEDEEVRGHRVLLAASSPVLRGLLARHGHHPHPLVLLRGVQAAHMLALIDFIYLGEVDVAKDTLPTFLQLAKDLQVRGLSGEKEGRREEKVEAKEEKAEAMEEVVKSENKDENVLDNEKTNMQTETSELENNTEKVESHVVKTEAEVQELETGAYRLNCKLNELMKDTALQEDNNRSLKKELSRNKSVNDLTLNKAKKENISTEDAKEEDTNLETETSELSEAELNKDLPDGWTRRVHKRAFGGNKKFDFYVITDTGFKFRSQVQIDNYLSNQSIPVQVKLRPPSMDGLSNERSPKKASLKEKKKKIEYTCKFTSGDNIDTLVNNLMEHHDNCWTCKSCGVQKTNRFSLVNHVETHIEGTAYPCELCKKLVTTRHRLSKHIMDNHPIREKNVTKTSKLTPIPLSYEKLCQSNAQLSRDKSELKKKTKITPENLLKLNEFFKVSHRPNSEQLQLVANNLKMELVIVQTWFRRQRFKMKGSSENVKKRENTKKMGRSGDLKERKPATKFSPEVLEKLNLAYEAHIRPSVELAESLNLTFLVVKTWFLNKKQRDQKKLSLT